MKNNLEAAQTESGQMKAQLNEVLSDKIEFKVKLEEQRDRLEMLVNENQQLKEKVASAEEEIRNQKKLVKNLEGVQTGLEAKKEELVKL